MKAATANLVTLLATVRQYFMEDVAVVSLSNGNTVTLSTNRANAPATQPIFKRGGVRTQIGVEVSQMSVDLLCNNQSLIDGHLAIDFTVNGGLDGANMVCTRYFSANASEAAAGRVAGNLHVFQGGFGDIGMDAKGIHFSVMSDMELLNIQLPRNMYQAGCIHDLYDAGCTLNRNAMSVGGTVQANATVYSVPTSLTNPDDYFALGIISFANGPLAGVSRTIKGYANGVITPVLPLPSAPNSGDGFVAAPGCDKTFITCNTILLNGNNFRGYEFIPTPETSY